MVRNTRWTFAAFAMLSLALGSCRHGGATAPAAPERADSTASRSSFEPLRGCAVPASEIGALAGSIEVGSRAEWLTAKDVVVHAPGEEVFLGVVHPDAALFEQPFSLQGARQEHERFVCLLKKNGARVLRLVDILMSGAVDAGDHTIEGPPLRALQAFAGRFLSYDAAALPLEQRARQEEYKQSVLAALHPRELVQIILQQPTVVLASTAGHNTGVSASYVVNPVMNQYFMRDQVIVTARGMVVGKFNAVQREVETSIVRFAYQKLGIVPLFEVSGDARLEGGDFLPAGDVALIGQGLRTNAAAVAQLLDARVFGTRWVLVVKDPWKNQAQMHLDTYFNILGDRLAAMVEDRLDGKDSAGNIVRPASSNMKPRVDVYELDGGGYRQIVHDGDFQGYLEQTLGYTLIPVAADDQRRYGLNFLSVSDRRILAVDGVSAEYKGRLAGAGVEATWMGFGNLSSGYGAAHCLTQVLRRE
jgi:arginine deiminase